jgi:hypothetical protein
LFLTTLTLHSLPIVSSPRLIGFLRRISSRTEQYNVSALPPEVVSGLP